MGARNCYDCKYEDLSIISNSCLDCINRCNFVPKDNTKYIDVTDDMFEPASFTVELKTPLTEEQWDTLTDVDFDHTKTIHFTTKHGQEVDFIKVDYLRRQLREKLGASCAMTFLDELLSQK